MARADSRRMVFMMRGCACPSAFNAMPPRKSRYFFPAESKTYAPRPCVNKVCERLYVGRRNCSASLTAGMEPEAFDKGRFPAARETDASIRIVFGLRIMQPNRMPERPAQSVHASLACPEARRKTLGRLIPQREPQQ